MQTFLPFSNFSECARVIDNKRLWKQILEANQLYQIIKNKRAGYRNHPATLMWKDYAPVLKYYRNVFVNEWLKRRLTEPPGIEPLDYGTFCNDKVCENPFWFNDERLYSSHRAALLHKNFNYYSKFGWKEKPELKYYWPKNEKASL